jgi:hypothetical protein
MGKVNVPKSGGSPLTGEAVHRGAGGNIHKCSLHKAFVVEGSQQRAGPTVDETSERLQLPPTRRCCKHFSWKGVNVSRNSVGVSGH